MILAAVQAGRLDVAVLAVITVLNAAAAAFYYLRVVVYMFMREPRPRPRAPRHGGLVWAGLWSATVLTIAIGLFPGPLLDAVGEAAARSSRSPGVAGATTTAGRAVTSTQAQAQASLLRDLLGPTAGSSWSRTAARSPSWTPTARRPVGGPGARAAS